MVNNKDTIDPKPIKFKKVFWYSLICNNLSYPCGIISTPNPKRSKSNPNPIVKGVYPMPINFFIPQK